MLRGTHLSAPRAAARACRLVVAGGAAATIVLAPSPASAANVTRASGPLTATLTASTHTPKINVDMTIAVTATLNGKPAHSTIIYQYLFAGAVVSTRYPCKGKACTFTGHYRDTLTFPPASVGTALTLQVVVKAAGRTVKLSWAITSHK